MCVIPHSPLSLQLLLVSSPLSPVPHTLIPPFSFLIPERKKGFLIELLDETMMLQCTSKADMEDWVRDVNRLRGGVDLASGQNLTEFPTGQDIYEGGWVLSLPPSLPPSLSLECDNGQFMPACHIYIIRGSAH